VNIEEDRIAADGLFYCVPWMRQAHDALAAAIVEVSKWQHAAIDAQTERDALAAREFALALYRPYFPDDASAEPPT
jgi:hypothetical protein